MRVILAAAAALLIPATQVISEERPHIVYILTDDMGRGDLGCYGGDLVPTPNIDRLAREGIRFEQYYSASPICSPSRTGALTGMHPARWRITSYLQTRAGNRASEQADFLDPAAPTLARALQSAGYATAHIGKWHMGGGRDVTDAPLFAAYGFDMYVSTHESPQPHPDITATDWIWSDQDKVNRWDSTAFLVDQTLDFLRRHKETPCYVNLWPDDVHTPYKPSDEQLAKFTNGPPRQREFKAVLAEYDRQIGRLLAGLEELGIADKTLVLFSSDNGAMPTFGGRRTGGLRGSKLSLYEGGIRVPMIVRWPRHAPAGRIDGETVMSALDMFPTLCAIAGAPLPDDVAFDGQDMSGALVGNPQRRDGPLYWEYGRNDEAFVYPEGHDRSLPLAIRDGNWKLLANADGPRVELYDLATDRAERNNVAADEPEVVGRLLERLLAWRAEWPAD
jgi:arylsulfatase A-like enzyme